MDWPLHLPPPLSFSLSVFFSNTHTYTHTILVLPFLVQSLGLQIRESPISGFSFSGPTAVSILFPSLSSRGQQITTERKSWWANREKGVHEHLKNNNRKKWRKRVWYTHIYIFISIMYMCIYIHRSIYTTWAGFYFTVFCVCSHHRPCHTSQQPGTTQRRDKRIGIICILTSTNGVHVSQQACGFFFKKNKQTRAIVIGQLKLVSSFTDLTCQQQHALSGLVHMRPLLKTWNVIVQLTSMLCKGRD